jgi:SAM-dependent methyltransferase
MAADEREARYLARLGPFDCFYAPVHAQIVDWLRLEPGCRVLDAGCGTGGVTTLLAAGVGEAGSVVALDILPGLLEEVKRQLGATPYPARVTCHEADVSSLPFADGTFDVVWCSRVVHGLPDQLAGVRELRRVLKPGGRLVLREGGAGLRLLPFDVGIGAPGLENRLQVLFDRWFAGWRDRMPGSVPYSYGWPQMLRDAGCTHVTAKTFVHDLLPPFSDEQKDYLHQHLVALAHDAGAELEEEDRSTLARITDPGSPDYALNRSDLHVLIAATAFAGTAKV